MRRNFAVLGKPAVFIGCMLGGACWLLLSGEPAPQAFASPQAAAKTKDTKETVPAYHERASRKPLPATLAWQQFPNPYVQNAYYYASKIREVLYQQPCYCHCDRTFGHASLLDCYTRPDKHAAICQTCLLETFFAYEETSAGKTPEQIRQEIIHGDWAHVNGAKYSVPPKP